MVGGRGEGSGGCLGARQPRPLSGLRSSCCCTQMLPPPALLSEHTASCLTVMKVGALAVPIGGRALPAPSGVCCAAAIEAAAARTEGLVPRWSGAGDLLAMTAFTFAGEADRRASIEMRKGCESACGTLIVVCVSYVGKDRTVVEALVVDCLVCGVAWRSAGRGNKRKLPARRPSPKCPKTERCLQQPIQSHLNT